MTPLRKRLAELGACSDAIEWVGDRTLAQAIADCNRAGWLMWLYMRMACAAVGGWSMPHEVIRLLLECVPEGELPGTRRWAAGQDAEWAELYREFVRTNNLTTSLIPLVVCRIEDGSYADAAEGAKDFADWFRISPDTIRERLKRGRTLGRKAAA